MAKINGRKIKFVRSKPLVKVVLIAVLVASIAALLMLRSGIQEAQAQTENLRQQAAELEEENSRLKTYIEQLGTVQGIIRIAQEELGLVEPDSIIITPEN